MLKQKRLEMNYTQAELAKVSGVSFKMVQKYEQGVKNINRAQIVTLLKLAVACKCKIEDIVDDSIIINGLEIIYGDKKED